MTFVWYLVLAYSVAIPMHTQDACFNAAKAICDLKEKDCCVECLNTATGVLWSVGEKGKMVKVN